MTRLPPDPHSEPRPGGSRVADRLIDAVIAVVCWALLTGLAVALHAAASAGVAP